MMMKHENLSVAPNSYPIKTCKKLSFPVISPNISFASAWRLLSISPRCVEVIFLSSSSTLNQLNQPGSLAE